VIISFAYRRGNSFRRCICIETVKRKKKNNRSRYYSLRISISVSGTFYWLAKIFARDFKVKFIEGFFCFVFTLTNLVPLSMCTYIYIPGHITTCRPTSRVRFHSRITRNLQRHSHFRGGQRSKRFDVATKIVGKKNQIYICRVLRKFRKFHGFFFLFRRRHRRRSSIISTI